MMKNAFSLVALILLMVAHLQVFDEIAKERERELARWKQHCVYIEREPWCQWVEINPTGEPVEHALHYAVRRGVPLWVIREGGHYQEAAPSAEFTTDRELWFEEGVALLAQRSLRPAGQ